MIPWVLVDSNYVCGRYQKLDPSKTVFVGGLHGMLNAGQSLLYIDQLNHFLGKNISGQKF